MRHRTVLFAVLVAAASLFACGEEDIISGDGLFQFPPNPSCTKLQDCCTQLKDATQRSMCSTTASKNLRNDNVVQGAAGMTAGEQTCQAMLDPLVASGACVPHVASAGAGGASGGSGNFLGGGGTTSSGGSGNFLGGGGTSSGGNPNVVGNVGCGITTPSADCANCIGASCCSVAMMCQAVANGDCVNELNCALGCGGDQTCLNGCAAQYPAGVLPEMPLFSCLETTCKSACGL